VVSRRRKKDIPLDNPVDDRLFCNISLVGSIQYAAIWYLPAGVLTLKGGCGMGSKVIRTQMSESEVYICYMKCM